MSGLDPSRALIFSLQALQAGLVSRDFIMRELPWSVNVAAEQERIEVEKLRETLANGIASSVQALPQMIATGQGNAPELISKLANIIKLRQNGKQIEDAVQEVFPLPKPQPTPQVPAGVVAPNANTPTVPPQGPASEVAPPAGPPSPEGAPQPGAQGAPDIAAILSRLTGG
jgi:hypothetical protein